MGVTLFALGAGAFLGLVVGASLAAVLVRRAIIRNLRRFAQLQHTEYNARPYRDLRPSQIARLVMVDALYVCLGDESQ